MTYYSKNGVHGGVDTAVNNNYMIKTTVVSPNNAQGGNIFVPGSMRFAVMNPRNNV